MPIFQYVATDQTGAQTQGSYEAANEEQALAQLAQYGLTVTQLVPTQSAPEVTGPTRKEAKEKKGKSPEAIQSREKEKKERWLACNRDWWWAYERRHLYFYPPDVHPGACRSSIASKLRGND